ETDKPRGSRSTQSAARYLIEGAPPPGTESITRADTSQFPSHPSPAQRGVTPTCEKVTNTYPTSRARYTTRLTCKISWISVYSGRPYSSKAIPVELLGAHGLRGGATLAEDDFRKTKLGMKRRHSLRSKSISVRPFCMLGCIV